MFSGLLLEFLNCGTYWEYRLVIVLELISTMKKLRIQILKLLSRVVHTKKIFFILEVFMSEFTHIFIQHIYCMKELKPTDHLG